MQDKTLPPDIKSALPQFPMRLQTFLSHSGVSSRRAAVDLIASGNVCVNGKTATQRAQRVNESDCVCVNGRQVHLVNKLYYVLLNKPAGYVCTMHDEEGRPKACDLLSSYHTRLYNVGRLDLYSRGLIIFTNDGDFTKRLSHPSSMLPKQYIVSTTEAIPAPLCEQFVRGIMISGVTYTAKEAALISANKACLTLIEGKNREIRRVFAHFKLFIKDLVRVAIGDIKLRTLGEGQYRDLSQAEVKGLLSCCPKR